MADFNNSILAFPSSLATRRFKTCAYVFFFVLTICTSFFIFYTPSQNFKTVWLENILHNRTQFSSIFSRFYSNGTHHQPQLSRKTNGFLLKKVNGAEDKVNGSNSGGNFSSGLNSNNDLVSGLNSNWNSSNGLNSNGNLVKGSSSNDQLVNGLNLNGNLSNGLNPSGDLVDGLNTKGNLSMNSSGNWANGLNPSGDFSDDLTPNAISVNGLNSNGALVNGSNSIDNLSTNSNGDSENGWNPNENLANELISNGVSVSGLNSNGELVNGSNSNEDLSNGSKSNEDLVNSSNGSGGLLTTGNDRDEKWLEKMIRCSVFNGRWVTDDEGPFYKPGSCPCIDEDFDCFLNGRSENAYEKYRWQPEDCDIPRWNGEEMLKLLEGKRLVYVGDSLNRNMWESMVCMLRDSVQNKSNVFEASGNIAFKTDGSYSFLFTDHNFSVEFFRSTFLVQESSLPDANGSSKETLRLDLVEKQSDKYKDADILVFNTGHWWTHEKTQAGKDYYQEGSHIYDELNVFEALRKAMTTWTRWIDENIDTKKTLVFFRGYSASHFSGGKWNTGGTCDNETLPIYDKQYLQMQDYLPWLESLESALIAMKTPVFYLNVTRMSDFRKDAHPSIYRKQNLTDEERQMRIQDCSHWCLPGVPDTWNEIVYTRILMRHIQRQQEEKQEKIKQ